MEINVMASDVTSRLFEAARIIGVTNEHKNLLNEAGDTISSLRELCIQRDSKLEDLRDIVASRNQDNNKLERTVNKQKCLIEELEADKVTFRKLAEYMVDNQ